MSAGLIGKGQHVEHDFVGGRARRHPARRRSARRPRAFRSGRSAPASRCSSAEFPGRFVGPSIAYIVIRQGVKCRMAAKAFDEMNSGSRRTRSARPIAASRDWLARTSPEQVAATRHEVDLFYRRHGITFGAYGAVDERRDDDPLRHHPARHRLGRMGVSCTRGWCSACGRSTPSWPTPTASARSAAPA